MLFSCLVDADFLETEGFHARARGEPDGRGGFSAVLDLRDRLRRYMAGKREAAIPSAVNALRNRVLDHAIGKAALAPGLFTLTVPTGGGKTLASLSFALEHAVKKGMQRVIYVIPYTSIIEQTALVFRDALKTGNDDVLEAPYQLRLGQGLPGRSGGPGRHRQAAQGGGELGWAGGGDVYAQPS